MTSLKVGNDITKILKFLREIRKLQLTYRFTPKPDGGFENDAEHSWSVTLICMLLASRLQKESGKNIDESKLLKMALIHDVGEIITGDTKTWDIVGRVNKEVKERKAVQQLFANLPNDLQKELNSLWEECEKRDSMEAKIVKSVDRFDPVIHRTFFKVGWKNVEKEHASVKDLDERQFPRHNFSKLLTTLYKTVRDEAISKKMFGKH